MSSFCHWSQFRVLPHGEVIGEVKLKHIVEVHQGPCYSNCEVCHTYLQQVCLVVTVVTFNTTVGLSSAIWRWWTRGRDLSWISGYIPNVERTGKGILHFHSCMQWSITRTVFKVNLFFYTRTCILVWLGFHAPNWPAFLHGRWIWCTALHFHLTWRRRVKGSG